MMDAFQCDSKRDGWQGLTAGRGSALGASAAPIITAAMAATATAPVMAVFAAKTARFTGRLAAGLAVPRTALVPLKTASASAAAAAAMPAIAVVPAITLEAGLGFRRLNG